MGMFDWIQERCIRTILSALFLPEEVEVKMYVRKVYGQIETRVEKLKSVIAKKIQVQVEELVWEKSGGGLQSVQFTMNCDRLGGRVFVKGERWWRTEEMNELMVILDKQTKARLKRANTYEEQSPRDAQSVREYEDQENAEPTLSSFYVAVESHVTFKREREFLRQWWRAIEEGRLHIPEDSLLVLPKLIDNVVVDDFERLEEEDKPTFLVFENLVDHGFKPQSKSEELDVDTVRSILMALADFHYGMYQIRECLDENVGMPEKEQSGSITGLLKAGIQNVLKALKGDYPFLYDEMFHRVDELCAHTQSKEQFSMYIHGDPIIENVMLKYGASGELTGVAFVDLGGVHRSTPCADIYGFTNSSLTLKINDEERRNLRPAYLSRLRTLMPDAELPMGDFVASDRLKGGCMILPAYLEVYSETTDHRVLHTKQVMAFCEVLVNLRNTDIQKTRQADT